MNTTPTDGVVLKQDVLGRVKTPLARREQLLDEFERSGLPGLKFAELAGIKYPTFATWAQKRRRARGAYAALKVSAPGREKVRWLEAVMAAAPNSVVRTGVSVLVLPVPGGVRLEIGDVKQVELAAALLRALQKPC